MAYALVAKFRSECLWFFFACEKIIEFILELQKEKIDNNIWDNFVEKIGDIGDINNISSYVNEIKPDVVFHLAAQL